MSEPKKDQPSTSGTSKHKQPFGNWEEQCRKFSEELIDAGITVEEMGPSRTDQLRATFIPDAQKPSNRPEPAVRKPSSSPTLDYMIRRRGGSMPTLMEWLDTNYLGEVPKPLDGEALSQIPEELRDQVSSLPPEYRS